MPDPKHLFVAVVGLLVDQAGGLGVLEPGGGAGSGLGAFYEVDSFI